MTTYIPKTRTYATLTKEEREMILREFDYARDLGATDPGHAAAIAANHVFKLTDKQWNGPTAPNYYAIALTVAFHNGRIAAQFKV